MTKNDIIAKVKELNLPAGGCIVFGSCPLAVAGLREANDVDMLVDDEIFESLRKAGWTQVVKGESDKPLT